VAGERGGDPGPERRQVDRRCEAEHGHDVAAEVRLPEQPPRRAHRLLLGHGIGTDRLILPAGRCLALELDRRRGRRVYGQRPLPQRGAGTGAGIHRPRRVSSRARARLLPRRRTRGEFFRCTWLRAAHAGMRSLPAASVPGKWENATSPRASSSSRPGRGVQGWADSDRGTDLCRHVSRAAHGVCSGIGGASRRAAPGIDDGQTRGWMGRWIDGQAADRHCLDTGALFYSVRCARLSYRSGVDSGHLISRAGTSTCGRGWVQTFPSSAHAAARSS
jgi:hypothetical protein